MTVDELEQALRDERLTAFYYGGDLKTYAGIADKATGRNVFGLSGCPDGGAMAFITDGERGIARFSKKYGSMEDACDGLLATVRRESYLDWAHMVAGHMDAYTDSLAEWLMRRDIDCSRKKAYRTVEYLKQDGFTFCEFMYYVKNHAFVRPELARSILGWTAERLYAETRLSPQGAFCYMVYLKTKPGEAKAGLDRGLPDRDSLSGGT